MSTWYMKRRLAEQNREGSQAIETTPSEMPKVEEVAKVEPTQKKKGGRPKKIVEE